MNYLKFIFTILLVLVMFSLQSCNFLNPPKEKNTSTSVTKSSDITERKSVSKSESDRTQKSVEGSIDFAYLFNIFLILDEEDYLKECKIITRPKLPADFGITSATRGGFDPILAQYYSQMAFSSGYSPKGISKYAWCMLTYATLVAQSHMNLLKELESIQDYDLADLVLLAKLSYEKTKKEGITDPVLKEWLAIFKQGIERCRFNVAINEHLCGNLVLDLSTQTLRYRNLFIWSSTTAMGVSGSYRYGVSSDRTQQRIHELSKSISTKKDISVKKILQ